MAQPADLAREAADEAPIETNVGIVEHERRLREPRDDAAGEDIGPPGDPVVGALRDPFVDQRASIGARDRRFGRAQVPQPAEAEQAHCPFFGGRSDLERRTRVADHHLAGECKTAGIDFTGPGRIGGPQILRRNDQPVRLARPERQPQKRHRR